MADEVALESIRALTERRPTMEKYAQVLALQGAEELDDRAEEIRRAILPTPGTQRYTPRQSRMTIRASMGS